MIEHFLLNVVYSAQLTLKIILSFFVLIGFCLASYTTINLILTYLEFNVITTIRIIEENPVIFPKVTICNKNFFTTKYAYDFLLDKKWINNKIKANECRK